MIKDMLARINLNPETFDKQKTTLILTTILSAAGVGVLTVVDALGLVGEDDAPTPSDPN